MHAHSNTLVESNSNLSQHSPKELRERFPLVASFSKGHIVLVP